MDNKKIAIIDNCGVCEPEIISEEDIEKAWERVKELMKECGVKTFSEYLEYLAKEWKECNNNYKTEKNKPWEKKKFYQ